MRSATATFFSFVLIVITTLIRFCIYARCLYYNNVLRCIGTLIPCSQMKRAANKKQNKIPQIFRLNPSLVSQIEREAERTHRKKTAIIEMALQEYFLLKRA